MHYQCALTQPDSFHFVARVYRQASWSRSWSRSRRPIITGQIHAPDVLLRIQWLPISIDIIYFH